MTTLVPFISVSNPWGLCMTSEYILNFLPASKLIHTKESIWNSVWAFFVFYFDYFTLFNTSNGLAQSPLALHTVRINQLHNLTY